MGARDSVRRKSRIIRRKRESQKGKAMSAPLTALKS
jgi:hypothetical protein